MLVDKVRSQKKHYTEAAISRNNLPAKDINPFFSRSEQFHTAIRALTKTAAGVILMDL